MCIGSYMYVIDWLLMSEIDFTFIVDSYVLYVRLLYLGNYLLG